MNQQNTIKIEQSIYEEARRFCDKQNIRFKSFVEEAISEAMNIGTSMPTGESVDMKDKKLQAPFLEYDKKAAKSLLLGICVAHENAYRRGFQQGFLTRSGLFSECVPIPDSFQIYKWRFWASNTIEIAPPGTLFAGRRASGKGSRISDRLLGELMDGGLPYSSRKSNAVDNLRRLIFSLEPSPHSQQNDRHNTCPYPLRPQATAAPGG